MQSREIVAPLVAIILALVAIVFVKEGWLSMIDLSAALAFVLVTSIVGVLFWGFKPRIVRYFRPDAASSVAPSQKNMKEAPTAEVQSGLSGMVLNDRAVYQLVNMARTEFRDLLKLNIRMIGEELEAGRIPPHLLLWEQTESELKKGLITSKEEYDALEDLTKSLNQGTENRDKPDFDVWHNLCKNHFERLKRLGLVTEKGTIPQVMKTSDRGYDPDRATKLDPKFAGVHALFFWPKKYSWEKGERNPSINMPYTKVVIKDKDVFWWGTYAEDLFLKGKIEHNNAPGDFETEDEMLIYLRKRGFSLHQRPVSQKDLLGDAGLDAASQ